MKATLQKLLAIVLIFALSASGLAFSEEIIEGGQVELIPEETDSPIEDEVPAEIFPPEPSEETLAEDETAISEAAAEAEPSAAPSEEPAEGFPAEEDGAELTAEPTPEPEAEPVPEDSEAPSDESVEALPEEKTEDIPLDAGQEPAESLPTEITPEPSADPSVETLATPEPVPSEEPPIPDSEQTAAPEDGEAALLPEEDLAGADAETENLSEESGLPYQFVIENGVLKDFIYDEYEYISVVVPEGVTAIGDHAFADARINGIVLPEGIESIGTTAFVRCRFTNVVLPSTVKSIAYGAFYECYFLESISLPAGLESIGDSAFYACAALSSISIPESVTHIGERAFGFCKAFTSISLPDNIENISRSMFYSCSGLQSIDFPANIRSIGESAFELCTGLKSITIPEGVTSLAKAAFGQCSELKDIYLPRSLASIHAKSFYQRGQYNETKNMGRFYAYPGSYAEQYLLEMDYNLIFPENLKPEDYFRIKDGVLVGYHGYGGDVVIPSGVKSIGASVFFRNDRITSVVVPEGVKQIDDAAFMGCTNLASVSLPASVTGIGESAFRECTGLEEIALPKGLKSLGGGAFADCKNLRSIAIPSGVAAVQYDCFSGCRNLTGVYLPDSVTSIGSQAFLECISLEAISLPSKLKEIGVGAFMKCAALRSITIPAGVTELPNSSFSYCSSLESIVFPSGLTRIGNYSFEECHSLKSVSFPNSLVYLGMYNFTDCAALESVYGGNLKTVGMQSFSGCPKLTIYGKAGTTMETVSKQLNIPFVDVSAQPVEITLEDSEITLAAGQSYQIKLSTDPEYAFSTLKYTSSKPKVVRVDKLPGWITAVSPGTATITIKSESGSTAKCKVTVKKAAGSIRLSRENLHLGAGESFRLDYILPAGTLAEVSWHSTNPSVITVDESGLVTAIASGEGSVIAETHNDKRARCDITVFSAPESIVFEQESYRTGEGMSGKLSAFLNDGSAGSISYASLNPEILAVEADGSFTAIAPGTATVTATAYNGVSASAAVLVQAAPDYIYLEETSITLGIGDSFTLAAHFGNGEEEYSGSLAYASSNAKYASVDANGIVTAKRAGSATVRVKTINGLTAECKVTVKKAPTSIKLSPAKLEMGVGESTGLSFTLTKGSAASVSFASSNSAVVSVDESGRLTANSAGAATITAATHNGKRAKCSITVFCEPESIHFEEKAVKLGVGQKYSPIAVLSEGSRGSISYASDNAAVVQVNSETGACTAVGTGKAVITASTHNGLSDSCEITVLDAPIHMAVRDKKLTLGVGEESRLRVDVSADGNRECVGGLQFKSSSTKVATVDESGMITAKRAGSASISVKTYNGLTSKCTVTVLKAPTSIKLSEQELELGHNESYQLTAAVSKGSGGVIRFESSDPNIVSVNEDGVIIANRTSGSAVITASTYNGLWTSCIVRANPEPTAIHFPVDSVLMNVGMKVPAAISVEGGMCASYSHTSTNAKVAVLNAKGEIVAKAAGTAEITIETYNGHQDSIYVEVKSAPRSYKLDLPSKLEVGQGYDLLSSFTSSPACDPYLAIASVKLSNERAVVMENEEGVWLLPLLEGNTTLVIKTYNGKTVKKTFKIVPPSDPITPDEVSPEVMDVTRESFKGTWFLKYVSFLGEMIPAREAGLDILTMQVYTFDTVLDANDDTSEPIPHRLSGNALILMDGDTNIRCAIHENGMLSMPISDTMCLWFSR